MMATPRDLRMGRKRDRAMTAKTISELIIERDQALQENAKLKKEVENLRELLNEAVKASRCCSKSGVKQ